jgi:ketosteroid isomerase-like protein
MHPTFTSSRLLGWVAASLAIGATACGQNVLQQQGTEVANEVTAAWSKAFDSGDAAALAALYADDARTMPPGAAPVVGRKDIEAYWRSDIGEGAPKTTLTPIDAVAVGNTVHVEGTYDVEGAQGIDLARGQYQQLWTREDGGWRVRREMWRMDPALQRSTEVAEGLTSLWTKTYNAHDGKALGGLYDDDAVLSSVQDGTFEGRPAIESFWVRDFGDSKPSSALTLTDVYLAGELAHLEGEYKVTDNGKVTEGRYTQLWMREGNGWRIHRELWWR